MRSRAQTIAIILSRYKKKHGMPHAAAPTAPRTFATGTRPVSPNSNVRLLSSSHSPATGMRSAAQIRAQLMHDWEREDELDADPISAADARAQDARRDAQDAAGIKDILEAEHGEITVGGMTADWKLKGNTAHFGTVSSTSDDAWVGDMYKDPDRNAKSNMDVRKIFRAFIDKVLANPKIKRIRTLPVNDKIRAMMIRFGGVEEPNSTAGTGVGIGKALHVTIDVDQLRDKLKRFVKARNKVAA